MSLYIALRRPRPHLSAYVGLRLVLGAGPRYQVVSVNVTNRGSNDVTISNIGWRAGPPWDRKHGVQMVDYGPGAIRGSTIPCKLAHGETATYHLRAEGPTGWLGAVQEHGFFPEVLTSRRSVDSVRLVVSTSVGVDLLVQPEMSLLEAIWREQEIYFANRSS